MEIKLRARLSAYAKLSSIESTTTQLPSLEGTTEGEIVGVGADGNYTLMDSVENKDIDTLFEETDEPEAIKKDEIDELFEEQPEEEETVTHSQIDSLFEGEEEG